MFPLKKGLKPETIVADFTLQDYILYNTIMGLLSNLGGTMQPYDGGSKITCPNCYRPNYLPEGTKGGKCLYCGARLEIKESREEITDHGNGYSHVETITTIRKLESK